MSQKENSIQEVREILSPIKERPNVEPRPEFVYELKSKIRAQKNKKPTYLSKKPLLALGSVAVLLLVITLSFFSGIQQENAGPSPSDVTFPILEQSQVDLVLKVEYGDGENQVGFSPRGFERDNVVSFDIEDGNFFILDDKNKRIFITDVEGNSRIIPVESANFLTDILVREDIFVLDSAARLVYQYSQAGELVETHTVSETIRIPTGLGFHDEYGVTVHQDTMAVSLKTGERIADEDQSYKAVRINETEGKIRLQKNKDLNDITIPFEHSYGGILIHSATNHQIVFTKTEVAPETKTIMAESHVYVINHSGEIQGAVRIPLENMAFAPRHLIKTDENKIYLLSPERDNLAIYELKAGKAFEKLLDDRIKAEQPPEKNVGFDYKTHGEPFPELEQDLAEVFTTDTIFASYSNKNLVNGVSINEEGTVIVDFQNFHEPGPSSAEKKEIYDTLAGTVFKYPEVEEVYFQFDGSFSDWCYWLETVEESIVRTSYDLDLKTRSVIELIRHGELDRLKDEYGAKFIVNEDKKIIFEGMDIPELAIGPENFEVTDSMEMTTGFEDGDTYNFFYFLYSSEVDTAFQLFVQYKKDQNGQWVLSNIRTNH